ncbi:MAG: hypothetical protein ABEJ30_04840 [Halorientalis sp.]
MNVRLAAMETRNSVLTRRWWEVALGTLIASAVTLGVIVTTGLKLSPLTLAGGGLGGFVTGVLVGTNPFDAIGKGVRVGVLSGLVAAFGVSTIVLALWFAASGQVFAQFSYMFFAVLFLLYVPLNGLTATVGAVAGTMLHRFVFFKGNESPSN